MCITCQHQAVKVHYASASCQYCTSGWLHAEAQITPVAYLWPLDIELTVVAQMLLRSGSTCIICGAAHLPPLPCVAANVDAENALRYFLQALATTSNVLHRAWNASCNTSKGFVRVVPVSCSGMRDGAAMFPLAAGIDGSTHARQAV
jgi:hypothetical protein